MFVNFTPNPMDWGHSYDALGCQSDADGALVPCFPTVPQGCSVSALTADGKHWMQDRSSNNKSDDT